MPKFMTLIGLILSALVVLIFAFDLALEFPFRRAQPTMDGIFVVCGLLLAYLSWTTMREQI